jgi:hypothetical protein
MPNVDLQEALAAMGRWQRQALREGRCLGCGARVPGDWPPGADYRPPEGWAVYGRGEGADPEDMPALFCPACEESDHG